jgi:hypothetical protein
VRGWLHGIWSSCLEAGRPAQVVRLWDASFFGPASFFDPDGAAGRPWWSRPGPSVKSRHGFSEGELRACSRRGGDFTSLWFWVDSSIVGCQFSFAEVTR